MHARAHWLTRVLCPSAIVVVAALGLGLICVVLILLRRAPARTAQACTAEVPADVVHRGISAPVEQTDAVDEPSCIGVPLAAPVAVPVAAIAPPLSAASESASPTPSRRRMRFFADLEQIAPRASQAPDERPWRQNANLSGAVSPQLRPQSADERKLARRHRARDHMAAVAYGDGHTRRKARRVLQIQHGIELPEDAHGTHNFVMLDTLFGGRSDRQ